MRERVVSSYKGHYLSSYTQRVPIPFKCVPRQLSQLSRNLLSVVAEILTFIVPPC